MTIRDAIATAVYLHDRNMLDQEESDAVADKVLAALLSAPEADRLELAGKLMAPNLDAAAVVAAALPAPPSEDKL